MTPAEVEKNITEKFRDCTPGETVKAIAKFRWRRIFTLNVDDALEKAYDRASPQKARTFNYSDDYVDDQDRSVVPIVHLHGFAGKPEAGYVFDIKQYMRTISDNNLWAHILGGIIRSEPFIILGTSLEEPDLTYFVSDRDNLQPRPDRPPSLLIEPTPDAGTSKDCEEYLLDLYKGTALEFLTELDRRVPDRPSFVDTVRYNLGNDIDRIQNSKVLAEFHADFQRVPVAPETDMDRGPQFALGHAATWDDIKNDRDISRNETASLKQLVDAADTEEVCLVLGDAGTGKSTILRRLAYELAQQDVLCLWCRAVGRLRVESAIEYLRQTTGRVVLFFDNFADRAAEVDALRRTLNDSRIRFVGAERLYRFEHIKRVMGRHKISICRVSSVGDSGAQALIGIYNSLGLSAGANVHGNITTLAARIVGDPIAVACCRIMNNFDPLESIIDRSFADASNTARKCYLLVALASHCYREGIQYNVLSSIIRDYGPELQMDENGPLPLAFADIGEDDLIIPLNEAIAASVLRRCNSRVPDDVFWTFTALAKAIRPYVNIKSLGAGDPNARLASRLFDYDEVVREFLGVEGASKFYEDTRSAWKWNSRYWHQIALMRLEQADHANDSAEKLRLCDLAVQHARHAGSIEPNHPFGLTTLGKVLFGKMQIVSRASAPDLEEAIQALQKSVKVERQRNRVSVHPYKVLFNGVKNSRAYKATYSVEQRSILLKLAQSAQSTFSKDKDLVADALDIVAMVS